MKKTRIPRKRRRNCAPIHEVDNHSIFGHYNMPCSGRADFSR